MIGDNAGHKRKTEPTATGLAGNERIEDVVTKIGSDARAIVDNLDLDRNMQPHSTNPVQTPPPRIRCDDCQFCIFFSSFKCILNNI